MRIISGAARGIPLLAGDEKAVRPTTDRIKETLFNLLGPMDDKVVVDLFAGSGALGLEALSRGATKVFFIEKNRRTCQVIEKNLAKVSKSLSHEFQAEVICADYQSLTSRLSHLKGQVDMILADPPYDDNSAMALDLLKDPELAEWGTGALLFLEHVSNMTLKPSEFSWKMIKRKDFKTTTLSFWTKK